MVKIKTVLNFHGSHKEHLVLIFSLTVHEQQEDVTETCHCQARSKTQDYPE